jgi:hypothetical protein
MDECKPLCGGGSGGGAAAGGRGTAHKEAARAFTYVLAADSGAGPALRARAYAGVARCALLAAPPDVHGRGLHSLSSQLNLSACYGIGGTRRGCVARVESVFGGV